MDNLALAALQRCLVPDCEYTVANGLTDVDHILRAVSNHITAIHRFYKSEGSGGATKSIASIPMLEESIIETQRAACKQRFDQTALPVSSVTRTLRIVCLRSFRVVWPTK